MSICKNCIYLFSSLAGENLSWEYLFTLITNMFYTCNGSSTTLERQEWSICTNSFCEICEFCTFMSQKRDWTQFLLSSYRQWPLSDDWERSTEVKVTSELREGPPSSHAERSCSRVTLRRNVHAHTESHSPPNRNSTLLLPTSAIERRRPMQKYKRDCNTNTHSSTCSCVPLFSLSLLHSLLFSGNHTLSGFSAHAAVMSRDKAGDGREAGVPTGEKEWVTNWKEHSGSNN